MDNESLDGLVEKLDRGMRSTFRSGVGVGLILGAIGTFIFGPIPAILAGFVTMAYAYALFFMR